ncbi:MAG: sugar phosphate isomerase/epimerase [Armatimonadetes bacterium]|jgi:sugar phosphate isomerase/epimerase|nr:sugar phosphate isomerase/epimerase [Armatimonadota bacterium]
MQLVYPAYVPGASRLAEALPALAAQGVQFVEWLLGNGEYFDAADPVQVREVQDLLRQTGVRVSSLHSEFGAQADLSSLDPGVRAATLETHRAGLALAGELGARFFVVHPGHGPCGDRQEERLAHTLESLRVLEPVARAAGVVLALENLPPAYPGSRPEELLQIIDAVASPYLGICFDTGHAHLSGEGARLARALLPRAVTMHLHDNDGSGDQHRFPGTGTLDWAEFGRIYRAVGCTAPGMLECAPPEGWSWDRCGAAVRALTAGADQAG